MNEKLEKIMKAEAEYLSKARKAGIAGKLAEAEKFYHAARRKQEECANLEYGGRYAA